MSNKNPRPYLRTVDLARAVGVHVNTVRLYEKWGLIPPAARSPGGYRHFTPHHLDCLRLARMIYAGPYAGRPIRRSGVNIITRTDAGDLPGALALARQHKTLVEAELARQRKPSACWSAGQAALRLAVQANRCSSARPHGNSA